MFGINRETILVRINKNFFLFLLMVLGILIIFGLIKRFYGIVIIEGIPFILKNKYFIPGNVIGDSKMYWTSIIYGLSGIGIIIHLFKDKFVKSNKKERTNKWYYKVITGITLGVYLLFYITNPWYTLQTHPRLFLYEDGTNITNKDIYFFLTDRYGYKWGLYKPFKTLDDSIAGLEFAMRTNESSLYMIIFKDLNKFGYQNILEKYKDKTFQTYLLRRVTNINTNYQEEKDFFLNNIKLLNYLERNALDKIIIDVSKYTQEQYKKFENKEITEKELYNNINIYGDKLYDINGIQLNIFTQSEIMKYKKNSNGDWGVDK